MFPGILFDAGAEFNRWWMRARWFEIAFFIFGPQLTYGCVGACLAFLASRSHTVELTVRLFARNVFVVRSGELKLNGEVWLNQLRCSFLVFVGAYKKPFGVLNLAGLFSTLLIAGQINIDCNDRGT